MAQYTTHRNTKNSNKTAKRNGLFLPSYVFTFLTTFAGVAFGVLLSVGIMGPMLHDQVASATKDLKSQVVAMAPASSVLDCTAPTSGANGGQVLGDNTQAGAKTPGGVGGNSTSTKTVFVHKLVSGVFATTTATNSNTGPGSTNTITTTNTNTTVVTNNNNVSLTNNNAQNASSGNATATNNTSSGATTTGAATNKSDTSYDLHITN